MSSSLLFRKIKTALRLVSKKLGISRRINYIGHVMLGSERFAIPLGGYAQELEELLLLQPSFKTDLLHLAESVANTECFVDIGANIGQTMLEYFSIRKKGTYYGFEPNPKAFVLLQLLNKYNELGAKLMPWACSDSNQPSKLYTLSDFDSSATLNNDLRADQKRSPVFVPCSTFDNSIVNLPLEDRFVTKIDVEGAEFNVLSGMQASLIKYRPLVICEVLHAHRSQDIGSNNDHKAVLENFLKQFNYSIFSCIIGRNNRLSGLRKIEGFSRNIVYADAPTTVDYVFCPVEVQQELELGIDHYRFGLA